MTRTVNSRAWMANDYLISDVNIKLNLTDLNYATFTCPARLVAANSVIIRYEEQIVFRGTVSQCKKMNRTIDGMAAYDVEAVEIAAELKTKYVNTASIPGLYIRNDNNDKTLGSIVTMILDAGGCYDWQDVSDDTTKRLEQVTYAGLSDDIPSIGFSSCSVFNALRRVVTDIFGLGLWFDYENGNKRIRYGEHNSSATGFPVPNDIRVLEKSVNSNVDGIIMYGLDKSTYVTCGTLTPTGEIPYPKIMAFRYAEATSTSELNWMAAKVFADKNQISYRYEVEFPAGWYNVREGDLMELSDSLIGLGSVVGGHGVKDVQFLQEKTVVGIGASAVTIFDIMAEKLAIVDNDILMYTPYTIDTGLFTLTSGVGSDVFGPIVTIGGQDIGGNDIFFIEGKTLMDNVSAMVYLEDLNDEGTGFTVFGIGAATDSVTIGASPATISYEEALDPDWFPWDWQWVEITVSYIMSDINTSGSIIAWDLDWPGCEVKEDGTSYQTVASVRRTVTHKWWVGQTYGAELMVLGATTNYPTFTMTHEGSGTDVTIESLSVNIVWYYDVGLGSGSLASAPTVDMQILEADKATVVMPWFTVYDSAATGDYIGRVFDLDLNGATGGHYFQLKMKNNASVSCRVTGSYIAFDEHTNIEA